MYRFTINLMSILAMVLMGTMVACLPLEDQCDPELDDACICETPEGDSCEDPEDLDCTCSFPVNDGAEEPEEGSGSGSENENPGVARFVLIEDMTPLTAGDAPGVDLDAVSILKAGGGGEKFATAIEDAQIGGSMNEFKDVSQALGEPDSACKKQNFVSLGGKENGGFVVLSFASENEDVVLENGDSVRVYELGQTFCNNSTYDDDPYSVSISVSTNLGTFVEIGEGGVGKNTVLVSGL